MKILPEYQDSENAFFNDSGLRGHLQGKLKKLSVMVEFLPTHDFSRYSIRILPTFEIPLVKVLFVEQISTVVTGAIEYDSESTHVSVDKWQYHWTHSLRWKF